MKKRNHIWIHCGLHKTGSTSIQKSLIEQQANLIKEGVIYPKSGLVLDAHHNLAWEICNDSRFSPSHGTISNLKDEICNSHCDVVISSEDFESALKNPNLMSELIRNFCEINYEPHIIIYLRKQDEYLISLYLELSKHGYYKGFDEFMGESIDFGTISFKDWKFQFDYEVILKNFAEIGCPYTICSYSKNIDSVTVFYNVIGKNLPLDRTLYENISLSPSEAFDNYSKNLFKISKKKNKFLECDNFNNYDLIDISSNSRVLLSERFSQQNIHNLPLDLWEYLNINLQHQPNSFLIDQIFIRINRI